MAGKSLAHQAMKKLREGKALTSEEDKAYRDYYRGYNSMAVKVYFDEQAELERFKKMAAEQGASRFSQWLLEKIRLGATGSYADPKYVQELEQQREWHRQEYERERDQSEEYRRRIKELEQENKSLAHKVAECGAQFQRIAEQLMKEAES